jgi:lantibiotic biosynthesis protein
MDASGPHAPSWGPFIDERLSAQAFAVAKEVAARLKDRAVLLAANDAAREQTRFPKTIYWEPYGVAQGDAGLAVACAYFDQCFPDEGWDKRGHDYLDFATRGAGSAGALPLGLFAGLAGLAFAARALSRDGRRYDTLLESLDLRLCGDVLTPAAALTGKHGVSVSEFDVITGVSGIAAYLLSRGTHPPGDVALQVILDSLVALTEERDAVPHWYTPRHLLAGEGMAEHYPQGNLNCGLAHGIPGPLAVMALALEAGLRVDGLEEAVSRTAAWLVRHRSADSFGANWPTAVPHEPGGRVDPERLDSSRAGWCYGAPGVARAVWLAARALGDRALGELAIDAMTAVYQRPVAERRIDSPTFCHGVAGLLQVTLRFAHDTRSAVFTDAAAALTEQLLSLHVPDRMLGYCCIEPAGNLVDQPGLLDGAPGVACALLAASTTVEPSWDRLFLLS